MKSLPSELGHPILSTEADGDAADELLVLKMHVSSHEHKRRLNRPDKKAKRSSQSIRVQQLGVVSLSISLRTHEKDELKMAMDQYRDGLYRRLMEPS